MAANPLYRERDVFGRFAPFKEYVIPEHKACSRCGITKPLSDFPTDTRHLDGRQSHCYTCFNDRQRIYREENLEARRAYELSDARKKKRNARLRARRRNDPEWRAKTDESARLRYELQRSGITTTALYLRDRGICHICGEQVLSTEAEPDHVIPLARGGANDPSNVKLSHRSCNRRKSGKLMSELLQDSA